MSRIHSQSHQTKPPQTKPDLSHYKRTSEIFPRSHGVTPVAARTRAARAAQPPKAAQSPVLPSPPQVQPHVSSTPSRSPFGSARRAVVPALPVGDIVPPLALEPVIKPYDNKTEPVKHNATQMKEHVVKEPKKTTAQVVETTSGESTPVTSNSIPTDTILSKANQALMDAQKHNAEQKSTPPSATYPNLTSSPSVKSANDGKHNLPPRSKSTPSLIEQLNRAVALKGEKAVSGMLEKLETPMTSPYNPPLTPRGRSMDFLSSMGAPLTPRSRPSSPERWNNTAPVDKKRATPLPKGDKMDLRYIMDAAKISSNEYETEMVNYLVRAPHSKEFDYDFFSDKEQYTNAFDIDNPESIDVLAQIEADGSVFALVGKDVRHGKARSGQDGENESLEWSVYENLEESQLVLGSVTYIDMEGNEREYWLGKHFFVLHAHELAELFSHHSVALPIICLVIESIYDEAMSIRDHYCTSIRSAACALEYASKREASQKTPLSFQGFSPPNNTSSQMTQQPQMPTYDAPSLNPSAVPKVSPGVTGQDIPGLSNSGPNPSIDLSSDVLDRTQTFNAVHHAPAPQTEVNTQPPLTTKEKQQSKPAEPPSHKIAESSQSTEKKPKDQPQEYESADSALPIMIVSLFSMFFSIVWFTFFKLPYRVCSTVLTFFTLLMVLRILWFLLADDNGAWEMGAGVDFEFNRPGIY